MSVPRACGMCGQPIPPMSKMAKKLTGENTADILRQMPTLSADSKVPIRENAAGGGYYVELCMSCWIHTGEANRR